VSDYDVVTVRCGLGGAAFAKVLAEAGRRVLVLERTSEFKDRVCGEVLVPWGRFEAMVPPRVTSHTLGVYGFCPRCASPARAAR
jgi:flavin-dependent dehydrogenase